MNGSFGRDEAEKVGRATLRLQSSKSLVWIIVQLSPHSNWHEAFIEVALEKSFLWRRWIACGRDICKRSNRVSMLVSLDRR